MGQKEMNCLDHSYFRTDYTNLETNLDDGKVDKKIELH